MRIKIQKLAKQIGCVAAMLLCMYLPFYWLILAPNMDSRFKHEFLLLPGYAPIALMSKFPIVRNAPLAKLLLAIAVGEVACVCWIAWRGKWWMIGLSCFLILCASCLSAWMLSKIIMGQYP